mgnify:CR=1 FL=1
MIGIVIRRLIGIALAAMAITYWIAHWKSYDAPWFDVPTWIHSPAFWGGVAVVAIWAWLPVLQPVGNREVSLAQEVPRRFAEPTELPQNEPFEMNGQWCIIWNGQYMVWDTQQEMWVPYRG